MKSLVFLEACKEQVSHPVQDFLKGLKEEEQLAKEVWESLAFYCFGVECSELTRDLQRQQCPSVGGRPLWVYGPKTFSS